MLFERVRSVAGTVVLIGLLGSLTGLAARAVKADDPPAKPAIAPAKPSARPVRDLLRDASKNAADWYVLAMLTQAQARAGDLDGARETGRRAAEAARALPLAKTTHASLHVGWSRGAAGDRAGGLDDLRKARLAADQVDDALNRAQALRDIAAAQADLGDREAASATLQALADLVASIRPDSNHQVASACLAQAQMALGDFEGVLRTVERAKQGPAPLGDLFKGLTLGGVAQAASSASYWATQPRRDLRPEEKKVRIAILARATILAESIESPEARPDADLAVAWARLGNFDEALRAARRHGKGTIRFPNMIDLTATPYLLSVIGGEQGKAGREDDARATFREALALIGRDPKLIDMRGGQVAGGQARAGDFAGAFATIDSLHLHGDTHLLVLISRLQARSGDRDGARATILRARREAEADPDVRDLYTERLAEIQAEAGDLAAAVATLGRVSKFEKGLAVRGIAAGLTRSGQAQEVLDWALTLDPPLRSEALHGLANGVIAR